MLRTAKQAVLPAIARVAQVGNSRRYLYIGVAVCTCACVYFAQRRRRQKRRKVKEEEEEKRRLAQESVVVQQIAEISGNDILEKVVEEVIVENVTTQLAVIAVPETQGEVISPEVLAAKEKSKRKKEKLKKAMVDGVSLVLGSNAGNFVESVMDLSQKAKGFESLKSGKLSKLFSKDIIPVLKNKLQKKKFPTIVGTTDSPLGDLNYEVSGITLESLEIDPSIQCDITDGSEALQIKLLITSALLRNISWKCGTKRIQEKGTANAEIVKGICLFRITVDRSQKFPKLSIKHCSIDLEQFNLELFGGKASWVYNKLTSIFSNKIKTKVKEKIDKMLAKKCNQFESKINLAATHLISLFSSKKKREKIETQQVTPHKKCFLYSSESSHTELDCILLDLRQFTTVADLQIAFFGELGVASVETQTVRVRFRDRTGTLVSVSKSTTIAQIMEHAEHICFYKESTSAMLLTSSNNSISSSNSSFTSSTSSLPTNTSSTNISTPNLSASNYGSSLSLNNSNSGLSANNSSSNLSSNNSTRKYSDSSFSSYINSSQSTLP